MTSQAPPAGATGSAALAWRRDLESWAIPDEILRAAPESPWGFPTALFARTAAEAVASRVATPSRRAAAEALPEGGSVLDVGAGGGAASLPLGPPAGLLVAVDQSDDMLATFARAAEARSVPHVEICGTWPEVAPVAPPADVVVCHHVVYNVADLPPFLSALDGHARRRVVIELTERHPLSWLTPLWLAIHGLERPSRPSAFDAAGVAREMGLAVQVEGFEQASLWDEAPLEERVAFARRQLCVGPAYDAEIAASLESQPAQRRLVTLWWDTSPPGE